MKSYNVSVCASGGGGNFQALIDAQNRVGFKINCLVVDRPCGAIMRAKNSEIPVHWVRSSPSKTLSADLNDAIPMDTDLIILAGFMPIVPKDICEKWTRKIINTHPSLLPKFGGKGMFGVKVQEAVMAAGEKITGCTVHYVTDEIDGGEIILQNNVEVDYQETPWQLGGRVFKEETKLLVKAVEFFRNKKF